MPQTHVVVRNILDLSLRELRHDVESLGLPSYRALQIARWIYKKSATDFAQMSNISKADRALLQERFCIRLPVIVKTALSAHDDTRKFLLRLEDGKTIECVLMRDAKRATLCLSCQVGCALGCAFCATGQMGFQRNLSCGEIIGQVLLAHQVVPLTNLVFMGMGEPLMNLDNVLKALTLLTDEDAFGISGRRITVSTCGIVEGINRLRESGLRVNLALSLNSPFEAERRHLMPGTRYASLEEVLLACKRYAQDTSREVSLEYVVLSGVNTTARHAAALARYAATVPAKINLIAYNTVKDTGFKPPEREEIHRFRDMLAAHRAHVTIRFRRGRDIAAGCGQLTAQEN